MNPESGDGSHAEQVRGFATERGYGVLKTEREGHAVELAAEAAEEGAELVAACGGDGTLNEVVRGLDRVDALDDVIFGVLPGGTGNNFAANVGIEDVRHGFDVLDSGERRHIDLGVAEDRPFLNSCVGGLTAEGSAATTPEAKRRWGVLAYVVSTLREATDFEGLGLRIAAEGETAWAGDALLVLVGNGRRFAPAGRSQADMEDGRFEVAIVEAPLDVDGGLSVERLFGRDRSGVTRLLASGLDVAVHGDEVAGFSLDGEMLTADRLRLWTRPGAVTLGVGEAYEPDPDDAESG